MSSYKEELNKWIKDEELKACFKDKSFFTSNGDYFSEVVALGISENDIQLVRMWKSPQDEKYSTSVDISMPLQKFINAYYSKDNKDEFEGMFHMSDGNNKNGMNIDGDINVVYKNELGDNREVFLCKVAQLNEPERLQMLLKDKKTNEYEILFEETKDNLLNNKSLSPNF